MAKIDFILTNAAYELISKVLSGKTLNFTRMAVGDGFSYDLTAAKDYTSLVNEVLSLDITKKETLSASSVRITSAFKNTDAQKEFYYREVGLFALDPDTGEEVLYAYGNRNDAAELITPTGSSVVTKQLAFIISVGNSANVTFNVNAGVYALQEDITTLQTTLQELNSTKAKQSDLEVERARITNLAKLTEGSTTGDAELIDGHVDDLGNIHENIGTALRTRTGKLNRDLSKLMGQFDNVIYYPDFTQGGYYDGGGVFNADSNFGYTSLFEVEPNTQYYFNVPTTQYYCFYDANKKFITLANPIGGVSCITTAETKYMRLSVHNTRQSSCVVTKDTPYVNVLKPLTIDNELVLNAYPNLYGYIKSDGTWANLGNTGVISVAIPTNQVSIDIAAVVSAHEYSECNVSFLKDIERNEGETANFCDGESRRTVPANTKALLTIPNDCKYMVVSKQISSPTNLPKAMVVKTHSHYVPETPKVTEKPTCYTVIVDANGKGDFTDIQSAIDYLKESYNVLNEHTSIFVKNGTYELTPIETQNAVITKNANKISIYGESRDGVKVVLHSTPALNNKIIEHGGESTIANISFYNYWTEDGSAKNYNHNSYCIHNDLPYDNGGKEYKTVLKNCYLYSEVFAPVGAGLQDNQTQVYENCVFEFNSKDENERGYNQWASLYVHAPGDPNTRNCALIIDNCTCLARKGTKAITLPDVVGSLSYTEIPVTIRRTIGVTNGEVITDVSKATHKLTSDSALNNVSAWNY